MRWMISLLTCCLPFSTMAHPHVFIDTGLEFVVDEAGQLTHVRVTWAYDAFYSLLVLEDLGLDQEADGVLSDGEEQRLAGFDAEWVEGYNGDLVVFDAGQIVTLSGPMEPTATMEDGRIVTSHLRKVENGSVSARALSIKAYDESYYTAYEINRPVIITGNSNCVFERIDPDVDGQLAQMQTFLKSLDADYDLEENDIPLVGAEFAAEIRLSCPGT